MGNEVKAKKDYIFYAKCIAVLLVFNSHLDNCYPISALATGGGLGNALFFFVSGYTWWKAKDKSFLNWYCIKAERIYLPTLLTNIVYILLFGVYIDITATKIFEIFIYPNKAWFCGAILVYAIVYYFLTKSKNSGLAIVSVALLSIYFVWYIFVMDLSAWHVESMYYGGLCRFVFYLLCMIVGLIYHRLEKVSDAISEKKDLVAAVVLFFALYLDKFMMQYRTILMKMQFLNQLFTLGCVIALFSFLRKSDEKLDIPGKTAVISIAEFSWEIYLTQTLIIPFCERLMFPFNVLTAVVVTCISSILLKYIVDKGLKLIHPKKKTDQ